MQKSLSAITSIAIMIAFAGFTPAQAQSFLDRGKELLQSIPGGSGSASTTSMLSNTDILGGLRDALRVGSERVVSTLGTSDGFNKSPDVHIPLPDTLKTVQSTLSKLGMSGITDDLELRLNRAAETAVPKAKTLFVDAISQMTIEDGKKILDGPNDAATQYFRSKMSSPLAADMKPIIDSQLSQVGAIAAYDKMISQYKSVPFVPDVKADLTSHVLEKAIDGIFLYLGREEAAIRENPAKRTTELLQKVFK